MELSLRHINLEKILLTSKYEFKENKMTFSLKNISYFLIESILKIPVIKNLYEKILYYFLERQILILKGYGELLKDSEEKYLLETYEFFNRNIPTVLEFKESLSKITPRTKKESEILSLLKKSIYEFECIEGTLDILSDKEMMNSINTTTKEIKEKGLSELVAWNPSLIK